MISKKMLLLTILCNALAAQHYPHYVHITKLFSDPDLALSVQQQEMVNTLIETINQSSPYEQLKAAEEVAALLDLEIEKRSILFKNAAEQDKPFISYKAQILIAQQDTLEKFQEKIKNCLPLSEKTTGFCKRYYKKLASHAVKFINKQKPAPDLTRQLFSYIRLECEHILSTYPSAVALVIINEHSQYPDLMAFWTNKGKRHKLLTASKKYLNQPKIQAAGVEAIAEGGGAAAGGEATLENTTASAIATATAQAGTEGASGVETVAVTEAEESTVEEIENTVIQESIKTEKAGLALRSLKNINWLLKRMVKKLFYSPFKNFLKLASDLMPAATSLEELTAEIEAGGLLTEDATTEALTNAENTVARLAKIGRKSLRKITERDVEYLSEAAENDAQGAIQTQLAQARAQAAKILSDEPAIAVRGNVIRWIRGGAKGATQRALRALNKTLGQQLEDATGALERNAATEDGAEESVSASVSELENLQAQVQALREQLTTPLTRSGRVARLVGNLNRTFAAKYPILHGAVQTALFMDASMGGQLAISWGTEALALQYLSLTQQRTTITANFQAKVTEIEVTQEASLRQIKANAFNVVTENSAIEKQINAESQQENNYFLQSLTSRTPQEIYLSSAMFYDQFFYLSRMLTPDEEAPLFQEQENGGVSTTEWTIQSQAPPIINITTDGWVVSQGNTNGLPSLGTGKWTIDGKTTPQPQSATKKQNPNLIYPQYPTNPVAHTWYNIYQSGNWIFNPNSNAFIQYQIQTIASNTAPQGDATLALRNSIFTDYIPPVITNNQNIPTYVIQVEMTINTAQYPFFAGIFFNGGRWISGSQDLMNQYRLFGFYGNTNQTITAYATETAYTTASNELQATTSFTGLEQVFASAQTRQSWGAVQNGMIPNPIYPTANNSSSSLEVGKTYILTAATQPTQIIISLDEQTKQGTITPVFGPQIIPNRNPFVFIYHNIGFISGGCSTTFKILQPKQLVYSAEALQKFKEKIGLIQQSPGEAS